jgi:hypothetical protein
MFYNILDAVIKINLKNIENYESQYWVYLDSENKWSFRNKRTAQDFLTKISNDLTNDLVFINDEYCSVNEIYRQYYFIINDFKIRWDIENSLDFIKNKISLILFRSGGENRNTLVIGGVESMLFELKAVYKYLEDVAISSNDTVIRHKIATKDRIIDLFIMDFKRFEDEISVSRSEIRINHDIKLRKVI